MTRQAVDTTMDFLTSVVGEEVRTIEDDLGGGYVRLAVSEAARRQAKHDIRWVEDVVIELLRNARDAGAHHIYLATGKEGSLRTIVVLDDGQGIPEALFETVFEPRVTSKLTSVRVDEWGVHGRGMALYSIRENVRTARIVTSCEGRGTALFVEVDTETLPERADQSSMPKITGSGTDSLMRGPHNILRTVVEFALRNPALSVYCGTIPEIIATIKTASHKGWIADELAKATDAGALRVCAEDLGLLTSERTAYRIISGQVAALNDVASLVRIGSEIDNDPHNQVSVDALQYDARGLKIAPQDMNTFKHRLVRAFDELGEAYYLDLTDEVEVTLTGETLKVLFRFEKQ